MAQSNTGSTGDTGLDETSEPTWVPHPMVEAVHTMQLQEHGGLQGTRDANALGSALARPRHKYHYEPGADLADLAAAYAYGLATCHGYADGNKRTAFVIAAIFLELNGYDLDVAHDDMVETMRAVADHRLGEAELAVWMRAALVPLPPSGVEGTANPAEV